MSPSAAMKPVSSAALMVASETAVMPDTLTLTNRRSIRCERSMLLVPMARDIDSSRNPNAIAWREIVEKANKPRRPARPSNQPAMEPDRHHFGGALALGIEHVERVLEICEELIAIAKTLRVDESHIVGVERVGDDEMRSLWSLDPVGQIIRVGVRRIEESSLVENGVERVHGAA